MREAEKDNAWYVSGGCLVNVGFLFLFSFLPHLAHAAQDLRQSQQPSPGVLCTLLQILRVRERSRRNWVCREKPWDPRPFVQSIYSCYIPTMCKSWAYNCVHPCLEDAGRGLVGLRHVNRRRVTQNRVTFGIIRDADTMGQAGSP